MTAVAGVCCSCSSGTGSHDTLCVVAFTPPAVIGLNADLKMPRFTLKSNARPALLAYPPPVNPPQAAKKEKHAAAVLSTTARAAKVHQSSCLCVCAAA